MELEVFTDRFSAFVADFEKTTTDTIVSHKDDFADYVREQLYCGLFGDESKITPNYLDDPYWKTPAQAQAWADYKERITPAKGSYLGFAPRDKITPNLIIRGDFYDSISAIPSGDGVQIASRSELGADITAKYGDRLFMISPSATRYFVDYILLPQIEQTYKDKVE